MASTNRLPRSLHKRNRRRPIQPMVEGLELRLVLSSSGGAAALMAPSVALAKGVMGPNGQLIPLVTPGPSGYTPRQLQDSLAALSKTLAQTPVDEGIKQSYDWYMANVVDRAA